MDFDLISADINTTPQQPTHHKKQSTFANVPFTETDGFDDFVGFSVEETQITQLSQEIEDLKSKLQQQQTIIDSKDETISTLRQQNTELKNKLNRRNSSVDSLEPLQPLELGNVALPKTIAISKTPTTEGSALFSKFSKVTNTKLLPNKAAANDEELKHHISQSLNNFLDTLDFKFKEDETENNNGIGNDEEEYIYNPTAVMDIDGHLPQIRRSSLSEEEQERMELMAVQDMTTGNNSDINVNGNGNVVFNDSNVKNMNMNIINHHSHRDTFEDINVDSLRNQIEYLKHELVQMKMTKIQLIMTTSDEIGRLRSIIREQCHVK